jgi:hypothetical protein
MPGASLQGVGTQAIHDHDNRPVDAGQAKPIGPAGDRPEATFENIGKAQRVGFGRR